ncbi:cathepsin D-like [Brevipalpus obovatus]|uniref:cathepsin D-like n=1 Tax=Brevipalpus obovatus TaxID=246614 RepID=UPI003D9F6251
MDLTNIGNIELEAQEFLEAFVVEDGIDPEVFNGVLGLAPGENSAPKLRTVTEHMLQSKTASQFSLHFDHRTIGRLTFENFFNSQETGPIASIPLSDPNKWQFKADQVSVGAKKFCGPTDCKVNIDLLFGGIRVPYSLAYDFLTAIHAQIAPSGDVIVLVSEIPRIPNLEINVNGQMMSLNITEYSRCVQSQPFCEVPIETGNGEWALGQPFLFKHDSEFNFKDKTMSFTSKK